jgi:chitin deacetylase
MLRAMLLQRGRSMAVGAAIVMLAGPVTGSPIDRYPVGSVVYRVPVTERVVALTFDDGPRPPFTDAILDVLRDQGVVATFFLVGQNAQRHPELARRILREGHAVGNHGWAHRALDELSNAAAHDEIARGARAIRQATGVHPRILRPPFGALDHRIRGRNGIAADLGQTLVMWSVETRDWATRSPLEVAVGTLRQVQPGAVVLLHDGGGNREHVVTATRWMVGHLARLGYRFVTVPQLFEMAASDRR